MNFNSNWFTSENLSCLVSQKAF